MSKNKHSKNKLMQKEDLMKVAMISTNGKYSIANLVSEAVSKSNSVTVEKSQKVESFLEVQNVFIQVLLRNKNYTRP